MPIKKAAVKALRQTQARTRQNAKVRSDVAALVRKVRRAIAKRDAANAKRWLADVVKKVDKAAHKGVIKKNAAARTKSRLSIAVNKLSQ